MFCKHFWLAPKRELLVSGSWRPLRVRSLSILVLLWRELQAWELPLPTPGKLLQMLGILPRRHLVLGTSCKAKPLEPAVDLMRWLPTRPLTPQRTPGTHSCWGSRPCGGPQDSDSYRSPGPHGRTQVPNPTQAPDPWRTLGTNSHQGPRPHGLPGIWHLE